MLCCSIASWMLVRSASFILKQELTKFSSAILIHEQIFLTTKTKSKKKTLQVFPATMTGELNTCPANFTGMTVIKTQMASVGWDFFFHNFIEMLSQNSTSDYVTGRQLHTKARLWWLCTFQTSNHNLPCQTHQLNRPLYQPTPAHQLQVSTLW